MYFLKKLLLVGQEINQRTLRIKLKTTLLVSLVGAIFFSILILLVSYFGYITFLDKAAESQGEMARALAFAVDSAIVKQVELLKLNANTQFVIDALKENNLKYLKKSEKETQRYLMDIDKGWLEAPDEHPLVKEYLGNKLSARLKELKVDNQELINVIVTDKFGGLAGATSRTSGFYSFNKDWWLNSYAHGRGKPFVGNVDYDENNHLWVLPFAVPIEDELRDVIGIYKAQISLSTFFKPLANFRIGRTGNAVLADDKAYLVYHQKAAPFTNKICEYTEFAKILQSNEKWGIISSAYLNHGKKIAAYSEVRVPALSSIGVNWFVFVERDTKEIFAPLNKLIFMMVLIGIALTIILALTVFILTAQEEHTSVLQVIKDSVLAETDNENSLERLMQEIPKEK